MIKLNKHRIISGTMHCLKECHWWRCSMLAGYHCWWSSEYGWKYSALERRCRNDDSTSRLCDQVCCTTDTRDDCLLCSIFPCHDFVQEYNLYQRSWKEHYKSLTG